MWLLPSDNPDDLHRFFMWCRDNGLTSPGQVLVNRELFQARKIDFDSIIAPKQWTFVLTDSTDFSDRIREVRASYMDAPWVGILGDDCIPLSIGWEKVLVGNLMGWDLATPHDDKQTGSGNIGRGTAWSGDLVRAVGTLFFDGLTEEENYQVWREIAHQANCRQHKNEIVIRRVGHVHSDNIRHASTPELVNAAVPKIEELKQKSGLVTWQVDYSNVRVMVAVPTVNGALEYEFLGCLHETFALFTAANVPHEFVVEPFNADLVMARSKLFAKFMRSEATHLLMIDADMGWAPQAVGRLFAAQKDFVAIAGPKKKEPLQCAVTPLPLDKNYGKITLDRVSGTVEVAEVGSAFCLITRALGEKMQKEYPELMYVGIGDVKEFAFYIPMIIGGAYKAEDYSFCRRWRDIGGTVHVCPDIALKHIGRKTFEGAWSSTWPNMQQAQQVQKLQIAGQEAAE